jgi:AcrR family transcriptional regulator
MSIEKVISRRERKKQQTREALEATAWKFFKSKGYDATTIEDITDVVDVSPRTFFRYFDSKEAVLFGDWRSGLDTLSELILSRPEDEPPLVTLFSVMRDYTKIREKNLENVLRRKKLAEGSRKIGDYERNVVNQEMEQTIAEALAQRFDVDPDSDIRPSLYAAIAMGVFNAAKKIWVAKDGKCALSELLEGAFEAATEAAGITPCTSSSKPPKS